jgi:hypothetical protein
VPNILSITVSNPDQLLNAAAYGAGAVVQVQRGDVKAGPFTDEGTVPIVSGTTSYIYYDTEGTTTTWYRTRYENSGGTITSEWSDAFQPHTSLITLVEAQARVGDSVTQAMIDSVEALLAAEFGPLTGERTETFYLERLKWPRLIDGVYLSRRTDTITAEIDGTPLVSGTDFRLMNDYVVDLIGTAWYGDELEITYTPTDEAMVKEAILDLLTFRQLPSNVASVRIGQYSESYASSTALSGPVWDAALAKVMPAAGMGLTSPFRFAHTTLHRTLVMPT